MKENFLKAYIRCVLFNKFLLLGYILFPLYVFGLMQIGNLPTSFCIICGTLGAIGIFMLIVTIFGLETFSAYQRTKRHLMEYGGNGKEFMSKFSHYFDRAGCRAAIAYTNTLKQGAT